MSKHSVTQTDTTRLLVYSPYFLDSSYYKSLVIWTLFALLVTCPKLCILVLHWQLAMSVGFSFLFFALLLHRGNVVSQADYTDHLVFAPGTLGQCKARQLRLRKHGDYVYLLF